MKIKFGALVTDGRGKIGGHVASKNRAGAYLRTKVTPVNPNSIAQSEVRSRLAGLSTAWAGLDADERLQWNNAVSAYARTDIFGDLKNPTGFNLFVKLNANLLNCGESQIDVPPVPEEVAALTSLTPSAVHDGAVSIAFAETPTVANHKLIIKATPAMSPGKSFVKSQFRQISVVAAAQATPYTATTDYNAVFGAAGAAGQKTFFEAFYINTNTGQAGIALQASCINT